jgi:hypothetical protein
MNIRRCRSYARIALFAVVLVGITYLMTRSAEQPATSTDASTTGSLRSAPFVVDVAKRERFHAFADAVNKKHKREMMGHTANVKEQVVVLGALVRRYKPDARILCELGLNLGHSAATMLTSLPHPTKYVAFDYGGKPVLEASLNPSSWGCLSLCGHGLHLRMPPSANATHHHSSCAYCMHCRA